MGQPRYQLLPSRLGSKMIRRVKLDEGMSLCDQGKAERVYDRNDRLMYFRLKPVYAPSTQVCVVIAPAAVSSTAISRREHECIVGLRGRSLTRGLNSQARSQRVAEGLPAFDAVELALDKFEAYQETH